MDAPARIDLYGGNRSTNEEHRTRLFRRRLAVVAWLRETMSETMRDDPATTAWDALTRLDVMGACQIAMEQKNMKLASLLSQSTGRQGLRSAMAIQMKAWTTWGVREKMPADLQRAYLLLSGELDDEMLRGLSWYQDLAMRVCYNGGSTAEDQCTTSDFVAHGIKSYRRAYSTNVNPKAVAPLIFKNGEEQDVRYLLLELACLDTDESDVTALECLKTRAVTSNSMDHALSWHLYQTMKSIGLCNSVKTWLTDEEEHWLTSNYSAQLENAGLWHWAVYVANHLPAKQGRRRHCIMNILHRNCPKLINSTDPTHSTRSTLEEQNEMNRFNARVNFLKQEIHIDSSYFHCARVQRARYDRAHFPPNKHEYADMALGGLLNPLHRDVFLHLLPKCMLEGKDDMLSKMLNVLSQQSKEQGRATIGEWESSGDVVKLYLDLKSKILSGKEGDLNQLRVGIDQLTRKLGGSTVQAGRLSLPEKAKEQHDTSGLAARARRLLTICEQQMVGSISNWRFMMNEMEGKDAHDVVLKETGLMPGEFGAVTFGLEAGSLVGCLRMLLQKWLEAFA
jgi:nuclear pore complex protein Nup98-Nup96